MHCKKISQFYSRRMVAGAGAAKPPANGSDVRRCLAFRKSTYLLLVGERDDRFPCCDAGGSG